MKRSHLGVTVALAAILFFVSASFISNENQENNENQIIGVWKMSTDMDGEMIKIITKGHFVWTHTINNVIVRSAGGDCTFDGETYTENITFGTQGMSSFFGKKAIVKVRFEDKKIHTTGLLDEDIPLNEVWERIE